MKANFVELEKRVEAAETVPSIDEITACIESTKVETNQNGNNDDKSSNKRKYTAEALAVKSILKRAKTGKNE